MGEGHRYYDIRRWKDADVEESLPIYGCNTLMTEKWKDVFHVPVAVPSLPDQLFHGKCISGQISSF